MDKASIVKISEKYDIPKDELEELLKGYTGDSIGIIHGLYDTNEDLFNFEIESSLDIPEILVDCIDLDKLANKYIAQDDTIYRLKDGRILSLL